MRKWLFRSFVGKGKLRATLGLIILRCAKEGRGTREGTASGWIPANFRRGRGSHRKFVHERFAGAVTLSGAEGADAKVYQEKQIKRAIEEVQP